MKIKYILSVIAIVAFTKDSFAQYSQDAIRFSTFQTGSTSRIKAIGNAGTAIGGDLSSISGNPAGLGFFTRSELSVTPEFDASKINSSYLGTNGHNSNNQFNLANAAVVFYQQLSVPKGKDKSKGWLSINYGASYARTNNFYENISYGGKNPSNSATNPNNSIQSYFAGLANSAGAAGDGTLEGFAYGQNLIDKYDAGNGKTEFRQNARGDIDQSNLTKRTGGQSELDFSFGANYSNKLYLGLGVAITDIRYDSHSRFDEGGTVSLFENNADVNHNYTSAYAQDQITRGSGANVKLGVIYKPVEAVRLGFVFTSPTFYSIDDTYNEALASNVATKPDYYDNSGDYNLNYTMRTPLKLAGGAAIFIGKAGFISGDVEYIDYSTTHISSSDAYSGDYDNSLIKSLYRSTVNAHVGAEARLNSIVYLRGGYSLQGSPLKENGSDLKTVSGGIGFRFGSYYVDATYAHLSGSQSVYPYEIGAASPLATLKKTNDNAFLTLGYRF